VNNECGSHDDHQVAGGGQRVCALKGRRVQALAEGDRVGFEKPATVIAQRVNLRVETREVLLRWRRPSAGHAHDLERRTVEIDDSSRVNPASFVQSIDILCDNSLQLSLLLELTEEPVPRARSGGSNRGPHFCLSFPVETSLGPIGEKLLNIDGLEPVPDSTFAAVVGYAGLRADSGPGEADDVTAAGNEVSEL
jgi:hypothetical protein